VVETAMGEYQLKICRCYLKDYPKWTHYDLSIEKQREMILNSDLFGCEEDYIDEVIPYDAEINSGGGVQRNIFVNRNEWFKKNRNPNIKPKVKIFWYVDLNGRDRLKQLVYDLEEKESFYSADFTENYSRHEVEPNEIILESTKEAIFYQTIFKMLWDEHSLGEIKKAVETDQLTISRTGIKNYRDQLDS
jgi:hypothetical protein